MPAGHEWRLVWAAGREVDRSGKSHTDALQLRQGPPTLTEQSSKPVPHGVQHRLRPGIDEHLLGRLGEHLAAGVLEREPAVGGAEVCEEDQLVALVERQDAGRPARSAGARAGLTQVPRGHEFGEPDEHRRPGQSGGFLDFPARAHLAGTHHLHDVPGGCGDTGTRHRAPCQ